MFEILFVYADSPAEMNCSMWRDFIPARAINEAPDSGAHASLAFLPDFLAGAKDARDAANLADVIVIQRNLFGACFSAVEYWKSRGKVIVVDLDDGYQVMTEDTGCPSFKFWHRGEFDAGNGTKGHMDPTPLEQLGWGLKLVHGLTSPSKVILDDWAHLQPVRRWVPNYYHPRFYPSHPEKHEGLIIGWAGSATHLKSWKDSGIAQGLRRLVKKHDNVFVAVAGDKRAFDRLEIPPSRKIHIPWTPYALFHETLNRFDIGVIPLAGEYDRRRSFIKTLEFSSLGIPWIGTDMEPNRELRATGALVENTPDAWYEALEDVVSNYDERREHAQTNRYLAERWSIVPNARCMVNTYKEIYDLAKGNETVPDIASVVDEFLADHPQRPVMTEAQRAALMSLKAIR